MSTSPTSRELLTGSAFRLPLNPGRSLSSRQFLAPGNGAANNLDSSANGGNAAGGDLTSSGKGLKSASGAGAGHWTVWGEAAFARFDGEGDDLVLDGEVLTGGAAADWQQDRWLFGLTLSRSQGDGTFSAPATEVDDAVQGTVEGTTKNHRLHTRKNLLAWVIPSRNSLSHCKTTFRKDKGTTKNCRFPTRKNLLA